MFHLIWNFILRIFNSTKYIFMNSYKIYNFSYREDFLIKYVRHFIRTSRFHSDIEYYAFTSRSSFREIYR